MKTHFSESGFENHPLIFSAIGQKMDATIYEMRTAFQTWRNRRATEMELGRLSDRMLKDIGLCRGDIETISSSLMKKE